MKLEKLGAVYTTSVEVGKKIIIKKIFQLPLIFVQKRHKDTLRYK
jgi:hypothetical protein